MLTENVEDLHRLARGLLEHETLNGDEIGSMLRGEPMPVSRKQDDTSSTPSHGKRSSVPTTSRPPSADGPGIEPSPQPGT